MCNRLMKKYIFKFLVLCLLCGSSLSLSAEEYLYTVSNKASGNSVIGYEVNDGGGLTELPGSPFVTGGFGTDEANFSDHGVIADKKGKYLFVTNTLSNDISVFKIKKDGSLDLVLGSPFPSGGAVPTSLALSDDVLYVSHIGAAIPGTDCVECDYRGFRVGGNGRLKPIDGSIVSLENASSAIPFSILFNEEGDTLIGSRLAPAPTSARDHIMEAFKLDEKTGLLSPAPGAPYLAQGKQSIGMVFNPANDSQLFASALVDFLVQPGSVSSYLVAETGQISAITPEEVGTNGQFSTCWLEVTNNGANLFSANTRSGSISIFDIADDAQLTLRGNQELPLLEEGGLDTPLQIKITSNNKYLYTVTEDGNLLGWAQQDGDLTLIDAATFALADVVHPYGLYIVQKGKDKRKDD